ncbi:hypothetical protein RDI58_024806 [Solanum bulbocastanum]|uniref:S-protein homolog n=1 Tax=Solanum bulbocastanum TaxID=147425 RepID=A0AAN8T5L5_SOLBU
MGKRYHVKIIDDLPSDSPQLKFHCASKEDDFGERWLSSTQDFTWTFCGQFFNRTLYFCHFWWDSKENTFDVFNDPESCIHEGPMIHNTYTCVWIVKPEGFYLGYYDNDGSLVADLTHDWNK